MGPSFIHLETVLKPNRSRTEALGAAKQRCCLVARGHSAYVRTAEPYDSKWGTTVSVRACRPSCYWEATYLGRAFEPGSGEPGVANDAGWPAGTWDDLVHEQPPKGGLSPVTEYDPGIGVRDSAAFRPLSSCCQGSGTLDRSDPTLSVSAIVLSLSTGACWSPPSPCAGGWAGLASSRGRF